MTRSTLTKPLDGFSIGVTADRRSDEQISLLEGRGATCMHGATVRTHPLRPEDEIRGATEQLIAEGSTFVLLTTGIGVRGWLEAADALQIGEELRQVLGSARLLARGPKAHGAAITAGLDVEWNAPSATSAELIEKLDELAPDGARVWVQVDGDPKRSMIPELVARGHTVSAVPVYRWSLPDNREPAEQLVRAVAERRLDVITFTARPAAENFVQISEDLGLFDQVRAAVRDSVRVVCIGHVCAEGVREFCDDPIIPPRFRLGAMVVTITNVLADLRKDTTIAGHPVVVQGRELRVGDSAESVTLTDRERQVLNVLMARNGAVISKTQLLSDVWGDRRADTHVVEVTVGRLRKRLGEAGAGIETVVRRGYRLSST